MSHLVPSFSRLDMCITKLAFPHSLPTAKKRLIMFRQHYMTHSSFALVPRCIHSTRWCYPAQLVIPPPSVLFCFWCSGECKVRRFLPLSRARILMCISLDTCATGSELTSGSFYCPLPLRAPPSRSGLDLHKAERRFTGLEMDGVSANKMLSKEVEAVMACIRL